MQNELAILKKFYVPELKDTVVENVAVLLYGRSKSSDYEYRCGFSIKIDDRFYYYSRDVHRSDLIMGEELDTLMPIRENKWRYAYVAA